MNQKCGSSRHAQSPNAEADGEERLAPYPVLTTGPISTPLAQLFARRGNTRRTLEKLEGRDRAEGNLVLSIDAKKNALSTIVLSGPVTVLRYQFSSPLPMMTPGNLVLLMK